MLWSLGPRAIWVPGSLGSPGPSPEPKKYEFPEPEEYEFPKPKENKFPKPKKYDLRVELVRLDRLARSGALAFLGWTRTQIYASSWHV